MAIVDISMVGQTVKVTSDHAVITKYYGINAEDLKIEYVGATAFVKVTTDAEEINISLPVVNITVSGVAVISGADLQTKLGAILNF